MKCLKFIICIITISSLIVCNGCNNKQKKIDDAKKKYNEDASTIRHMSNELNNLLQLLDNEEYELLECLKESFVNGKIVYDKSKDITKINSLYVAECETKLWYALYNKLIKKTSEKIYIEDLYNIFESTYIEDTSTTLKELKNSSNKHKKSLEKLKDYTEWRKSGIGQNKHKESVTAESVWAHVSKASKITDEYDIEKFNEKDWEIICNHYEVKQDAKSTNNAATPLNVEEEKLLEHAKK